MVRSRRLKSHKEGRQIVYQANQEHALFPELRSMVQKSHPKSTLKARSTLWFPSFFHPVQKNL